MAWSSKNRLTLNPIDPNASEAEVDDVAPRDRPIILVAAPKPHFTFFELKQFTATVAVNPRDPVDCVAAFGLTRSVAEYGIESETEMRVPVGESANIVRER